MIDQDDPKPCPDMPDANPSELDAAVESLTKTADALETWCAQGEINIIDRPAMARELRIIIAEISRLKQQQPEIDESKIPYGHSTRTAATIDEGE